MCLQLQHTSTNHGQDHISCMLLQQHFTCSAEGKPFSAHHPELHTFRSRAARASVSSVTSCFALISADSTSCNSCCRLSAHVVYQNYFNFSCNCSKRACDHLMICRDSIVIDQPAACCLAPLWRWWVRVMHQTASPSWRAGAASPTHSKLEHLLIALKVQVSTQLLRSAAKLCGRTNWHAWRV